MADIVDNLYDASICVSSRKTYGTGQRAYFRFAEEINSREALLLFLPDSLSDTELHLAFYMAFLILKPTITKASTILGYENHVKYYFLENGCDPIDYNTSFLKQVRKGVKNIYPKLADKRVAFFLPRYIKSTHFTRPKSKAELLVRLATTLGFIGMLRPHTFTQLGPTSLSFVLEDNTVYKVPPTSTDMQKQLQDIEMILGFYVRFKSKTMASAFAYFPKLAGFSCLLSAMCPVAQILEVAKKGWVKRGFLKQVGRGNTLGKYIKTITDSSTAVSPYSLRIGGRTWYLTNGMDRQFVDYLGTWKSPEASALYYRESPAMVIRVVQQFYLRITKAEDP